MEKTTNQLNTEQQLLQARERGLREASQVHAMKAHGKVLGMDAFSWINPDADNLITVIESFPFAVHWIGTHDQIKQCLDARPQLSESLQSVIVYDRARIDVSREVLLNIPMLICLEGTEAALDVLKAIQREKSVFLFTTTANEERKTIFEAFMEANK